METHRFPRIIKKDLQQIIHIYILWASKKIRKKQKFFVITLPSQKSFLSCTFSPRYPFLLIIYPFSRGILNPARYTLKVNNIRYMSLYFIIFSLKRNNIPLNSWMRVFVSVLSWFFRLILCKTCISRHIHKNQFYV